VKHDPRPPTLARIEALVEIGDEVWVLPDAERTPHVPNIGFVGGERSMLVIESGIGIANGERTLAIARQLAGSRRLFVTASHHHPEHGYGVQAFVGEATIIYNEAQRDELRERQADFVALFSSFTPLIGEALEGVEYVSPDVVYGGSAELDLGGRTVELRQAGPAHTAADQVVSLPDAGVLFTGDLVEERFFAIMGDPGCVPSRWIAELETMEAAAPRVVVPGHGALGGVEMIADAREELTLIRDAVTALHAEGRPLEEIEAELTPQALARRPDWGNDEWVGVMVARTHGELID
jgi:glyoxylase-like metal-dependent hydrolase (beta-lactamase superfamily II)